MNITKEMDSFDVFHLSEDADEAEIKKAFSFHIDTFCGEDTNRKNVEGEYLINIYHYHYKKLMDPEERGKLLERRRSKPKNELLISSVPEATQSHVITSINREVVQKYGSAISKGRFKLFRKKIPLKDVYIVFGEDSSLLFAQDIYSGYTTAYKEDPNTGKVRELDQEAHFSLCDCFTYQNIFDNIRWAWFERPWIQGQIFRTNGILSTAILGSRVFPHGLIHNGKILECDFRKSYDIIHNYLRANSEYVKSIFENVDEEEVDKRMKLY
ncbi:MAG: hypothetical protein HFG40_03135 [Bacilli bacterium]|nr:hypothetical protein [Bacilli bacterium]